MTTTVHQEDHLAAAIAHLPRVKLGYVNTPIEALPRLSAALGGPPIYIKRDDLTGLAFGGNKTRMLEFSMADALASRRRHRGDGRRRPVELLPPDRRGLRQIGVRITPDPAS